MDRIKMPCAYIGNSKKNAYGKEPIGSREG